jgi:hypothetical protein
MIGILIWLVGLAFAVLVSSNSNVIGFNNPNSLIIVFCLFSFISIFSFLAGAQRGHWVRFVTVFLVSMFFINSYLGNMSIITNGLFFVNLCTIDVLLFGVNILFAKKFRSEYKAYGIVDYFDRYFPNNGK